MYGRKVSADTIARFWNRVLIGSTKDCWPWQAGKNSNRPGFTYGVFWLFGKSRLCPRLALSFYLGEEVTEPEIMHLCDNPICCNPHHLKGGSHTENMRDMLSKGRRRHRRGEEYPSSKLTDSKVKEIRELYEKHLKYRHVTKTFLANRFGVDPALVSRVIQRTAWRHVN